MCYLSGFLDGEPDGLEIRCPRCQAPAAFDEPFEFYTGKRGKPVRQIYDAESRKLRLVEVDLTGLSVRSWGGWFVVEKYPNVIPWAQPVGSGYTYGKGVVKCSGCHAVFPHTLDWPEDAYYRWTIRGVTLWSYSREHAGVLLEFILGEDRNADRYPRYRRSLLRLPRTVLLAKNRDLVVREIRRSLGAS